jgi:hypothetical protein
MEMFEGMGYEAIMDIPTTRRYRMIHKKSDLEHRRSEQAKAQSRRK